ncbi:MAG: hypothetical protein U0797_08750 [Gemmataceae bacterium]
MFPPLALCLGLLSGRALPPPSFPGVLDMNGQVAYVASGGGIDAVGLERGDLLWRSRVAQRPLAVAGGRLFALGFHPTNQLSVVSFDLRGKGERVLKTEVTDLPRWVTTQGSPSQTFRCDWRQQGGVLLIDWQAEARGEAGPAKRSAGQLALDLETGRVSPASQAARAAAEPVPDQLQKHALRWHGRAGGQLLAVALEDLPGPAEPREQRLVFRTWDGARAVPAEPREPARRAAGGDAGPRRQSAFGCATPPGRTIRSRRASGQSCRPWTGTSSPGCRSSSARGRPRWPAGGRTASRPPRRRAPLGVARPGWSAPSMRWTSTRGRSPGRGPWAITAGSAP